MQFKQRPLTLVCYICGREFGTKSLEIHLKSCRKKFLSEQSRKEKKDRIDVPAQPQLLPALLGGDLTHLQAYNQAATLTHKYKVLPSCRFCGRTFNQDSLKVHENACPKKTGFPPPSRDLYSQQETIKKPRTLVCCVCGRQFGLTSLKIHYPQCLAKSTNEQKANPKEEMRDVARFTNQELELINNKLDWTPQQIQSFNKKASAGFRQKGMVFCQNCRRTFKPEPFKKHLKNCQLINGKNVPVPPTHSSPPNIYQNKEIKKPKVLMCHICGRQFGLTSLQIHQKTCVHKFISNEQKKPASQRKPLPQLPAMTEEFDFGTVESWDVGKIQEYNEMAGKAYRNDSMYECPFCHRKFIEQSFEKHRSYCQRQNQKSLQKNSIQQKQKLFPRHRESNKHLKKQEDGKPSFSRQKVAVLEEDQKVKKEQEEDCFIIKELAEDLQQTHRPEQNQPNQQTKALVQREPIPLSENITFKPKPNDLVISSIKHADALSPQTPQANGQNIHQINLIQPHSNIQTDEANSICQDVMEVSSFSDKEQEDKSRKNLAAKLVSHQKHKEFPAIKQASMNFEEKKQESARDELKFDLVKNQVIPDKQKCMVEEDQVELGQCQKCGRKFVLERLEKHQSICKGNRKNLQSRKNYQQAAARQMRNMPQEPMPRQQYRPAFNQQKRVRQNEDEIGPIGHSKMLMPCKRCGRRFLESRVQTHEQHCKGKQIKQITKAQDLQSLQVKHRLPIETTQNKNSKELRKRPERSEKQNFAEAQPDKEPVKGYDQYQQIAANDLQICSKCSRKFKLDRIQVHQHACKGPPQKKANLQKQLKEIEQTRKNQAIRKTRQNFFQMAKDIKHLKKNQEQIDRQLSAELQTLQKEPRSGRTSQKTRINLLSKDKTQVVKRGTQALQKRRLQDISTGLENISKWKRRAVDPSPKSSLSKKGRFASDLPQV